MPENASHLFSNPGYWTRDYSWLSKRRLEDGSASVRVRGDDPVKRSGQGCVGRVVLTLHPLGGLPQNTQGVFGSPSSKCTRLLRAAGGARPIPKRQQTRVISLTSSIGPRRVAWTVTPALRLPGTSALCHAAFKATSSLPPIWWIQVVSPDSLWPYHRKLWDVHQTFYCHYVPSGMIFSQVVQLAAFVCVLFWDGWWVAFI